MRKFNIPLPNGESIINFDAQIGDYQFGFRLYWIVDAGYYRVSIKANGDDLVLGKGLHPGIDLLKNQNLNIGKIYLEGQTATIDNLGVANRLIYETV